MNKSSYFRFQHVIKFLEAVFGDNLTFEIESGDEIVRNVGRRTEDAMGTRTILEEKNDNVVFRITFGKESPLHDTKALPAVFRHHDFPKILRNRYREINNIGIRYWKIDYHLTRIENDQSGRYLVTFRFTVGYDEENL